MTLEREIPREMKLDIRGNKILETLEFQKNNNFESKITGKIVVQKDAHFHDKNVNTFRSRLFMHYTVFQKK